MDPQTTFHVTRHTCASRLAQSGKVTLQVVQEYLGHKTMRMTQRYAHLMPQNLMDAAAVLEQDANLSEVGGVNPGPIRDQTGVSGTKPDPLCYTPPSARSNRPHRSRQQQPCCRQRE